MPGYRTGCSAQPVGAGPAQRPPDAQFFGFDDWESSSLLSLSCGCWDVPAGAAGCAGAGLLDPAGRVTTAAFLSGRYNAPFCPHPATTALPQTTSTQVSVFICTLAYGHARP